jgi:Glyoxalase/Bleomycin resistance protein/Dioxygenase superfamily
VNNLAIEYRSRHGLPPISQLGIVVENVEESAKKLESQGIGPFLVLSGSTKLWKEQNIDRNYRGKMGLAYYQGIQLELLEPGEGSDFYSSSLSYAGEMSIQHLGFSVADIHVWIDKLVSSGINILIQGQLASGPLIDDFVYLDTVKETGLVVELFSWRLFGIPIKLTQSIIHGLGRI